MTFCSLVSVPLYSKKVLLCFSALLPFIATWLLAGVNGVPPVGMAAPAEAVLRREQEEHAARVKAADVLREEANKVFKATKDAAKAEQLYTRCLELNEHDWQARSNRATVRLPFALYPGRPQRRKPKTWQCGFVAQPRAGAYPVCILTVSLPAGAEANCCSNATECSSQRR
jgi:hypothetical protein